MYNSALLTQPSDPTALLYRSFAYVLRPSPRLDLAAADADAIIQLDPTNFKAWKQKGDVLRRQGDLRGAIDALNNAVGCSGGMDRLEVQGVLNSVQREAQQGSYLGSPIIHQQQQQQQGLGGGVNEGGMGGIGRGEGSRHSAQLSSSNAPTTGELQTPIVHHATQQTFMPSPMLPRESYIPSPVVQTPRHSAQLSNSTVPTQEMSPGRGFGAGETQQQQQRTFLPPPQQQQQQQQQGYGQQSQQGYSNQETATNYSYSATPPPQQTYSPPPPQQQSFPPPTSQETLTAQAYAGPRASYSQDQQAQQTFVLPPPRQGTPSSQRQHATPPPPPQQKFAPPPSPQEKSVEKDLRDRNTPPQKQASPPPPLNTLNSNIYTAPPPAHPPQDKSTLSASSSEDPPLMLRYRTTSPPEQNYIPSPPLSSKKNGQPPSGGSHQFSSTSSTPEPPSAQIYQLPADEPHFLSERPKNKTAASPTSPQVTAESATVPLPRRKSVGSPTSTKAATLSSPKEQTASPSLESPHKTSSPPIGASSQTKTTPPTLSTPQMDQSSPKTLRSTASPSPQLKQIITPPNTLPEIAREPPMELPYPSSPPLEPMTSADRGIPLTHASPPLEPVISPITETPPAKAVPIKETPPKLPARPPPSDLSKPMPPPPSNVSTTPTTTSHDTTARPTNLDDTEEPDPSQFVQPETRANTNTQSVRQPTVKRTYNAETVTQAPNAQALPFAGEDLVKTVPSDGPPADYTPPTPVSVTEVNQRLDELTGALAGKNKGSLSIRPYTTADGIDAIQLLYVGMIQGELTQREIGRPNYLHPTFSKPPPLSRPDFL